MFSGLRQQEGGPMGCGSSRKFQLWRRGQALPVSRNALHRFHLTMLGGGWGTGNNPPCSKSMRQSTFPPDFYLSSQSFRFSDSECCEGRLVLPASPASSLSVLIVFRVGVSVPTIAGLSKAKCCSMCSGSRAHHRKLVNVPF